MATPLCGQQRLPRCCGHLLFTKYAHLRTLLSISLRTAVELEISFFHVNAPLLGHLGSVMLESTVPILQKAPTSNRCGFFSLSKRWFQSSFQDLGLHNVSLRSRICSLFLHSSKHLHHLVGCPPGIGMLLLLVFRNTDFLPHSCICSSCVAKRATVETLQ